MQFFNINPTTYVVQRKVNGESKVWESIGKYFGINAH